jgi:hypothetical protein
VPPVLPGSLSGVPEVNFWIFNLAIPNLMVASVLVVTFVVAVWARLEDSVFEPAEEGDVE